MLSLSPPDWDPHHILAHHNKMGPKKNNNLSQTLKSMILLGILNKYSKKSYTKSSAFSKWYLNVKVESMKKQVWKKILTQQRLSSLTFLYRIKAYCEDQKTETLVEQEELTKLRIQALSTERKNQQIRKIIQSEDQQSIIENSKSLNKKFYPREFDRLDKIKESSEKKEEKNKMNWYLKNKNFPFHLRSISQQTSSKLNSDKQLSQLDILEILEKKIGRIEERIKVSGLRGCQLVLRKISYRLSSNAFDHLNEGLDQI